MLRQNGRHFADDIFKCIFLNENVLISIKISLKFIPKGPINNIPALVQIMAWRRPGDKPLSEPMMVNLLTHICVTRPQWVNPSGGEAGRTGSIPWLMMTWRCKKRLSPAHQPSWYSYAGKPGPCLQQYGILTYLPWTRWLPFRRWHVKMHFLEWKYLNFK